MRDLYREMQESEKRVATTITGQFEKWAQKFEVDHPPKIHHKWGVQSPLIVKSSTNCTNCVLG